VSRGRHPEIRFPDTTVDGTYRLVPEGVTLHRDIVIRIAFDPKENHEVSGLSWPDNYFSPFCSVPFSRTRPSSVREWAGLPESDPDVVAARRILGDAVDPDAPTLARVEQVFRFVMARIHASGGTPSDAVQDASPMETYALLSGGGGKGWCENRALVFYLFANAACIATRLVDIAGKFGPLKLTGHYFCESWIPEHTAWCFVDPQSAIACITARDGRPLHTLDIKRRIGLDALEGCMARTYDASTGSVVDRDLAGFQHGFAGYFQREIVLAYKFGYSKNRTYSRLKHFLFYPTHLVATFALPNRYRVKWVFLGGFATTMAASLLLALGVLIR
jgi:hypothetical protein